MALAPLTTLSISWPRYSRDGGKSSLPFYALESLFFGQRIALDGCRGVSALGKVDLMQSFRNVGTQWHAGNVLDLRLRFSQKHPELPRGFAQVDTK